MLKKKNIRPGVHTWTMDAIQPKEKLLFTFDCTVHRLFRAPFCVRQSRMLSRRAGKKDAMNNGIPCNEWRFTSKKNKDRITFRFVNDDANTPSSCTVSVGDKDPLTGEIISLDFLHEYYKLADHQIYIHNREARNQTSIEIFTDNDGKSRIEKKEDFGVPSEDPFADPPDKILKLREIAASLTGRMADVYEALLIKYAGGKEKISMTDIARKWGVSTTQICKDRDKIKQIIRKALEK